MDCEERKNEYKTWPDGPEYFRKTNIETIAGDSQRGQETLRLLPIENNPDLLLIYNFPQLTMKED
jgi:hypothetical protein